MPKRITDVQREDVLHMLAQGVDRETIAVSTGVTPGQVSAIAAHVKMGTYTLPTEETEQRGNESETESRAENLLSQIHNLQSKYSSKGNFSPIFLGIDAETEEEVFWNPDPETGAANPHVLIVGESGYGKTYTIACLLAELAQEQIGSIVFDYGQGFSPVTLPEEFVRATNPVEIQATREGVDINPLQIFSSDLLGPVNVAQRVADTFARVYPRIGVQQHAVLREAILDEMADNGIAADDATSWEKEPPAFEAIHHRLDSYARNPTNPHSRHAASTASHISTLFVFNTFRPSGRKLTWPELLASSGQTCILQLKGLEHSLEKAVTEFLLWNLIGYVEALGPSPLRCFVVLDEAHKLSFDAGSPVERILREGRKFGLGLILASQQPEDFSPVAFANTATKIIFQVGDEKSTVSRHLGRKVRDPYSFRDISRIITQLPRGCAYTVSENIGRVVEISSFSDRAGRL